MIKFIEHKHLLSSLDIKTCRFWC